jgi:hypothetical protein
LISAASNFLPPFASYRAAAHEARQRQHSIKKENKEKKRKKKKKPADTLRSSSS